MNSSKQMMSTRLTASLESGSEEEVSGQSSVKKYHKIPPHNKPHLRFIEENTRMAVVIYKKPVREKKITCNSAQGRVFIGWGESEWEKGKRKRQTCLWGQE